MAAISFQEGLRQLSFTIRNWLNSNAIVNKSLLPNNIELNKIIQSGFYFLNPDNKYYDAPLTSEAGALLWVMQDSEKKATNLYQFYLDKNSMQLYMRTKIEENEFDAWRLIKANGEITGISTEDLENYKTQILKEVANGYIDLNSYTTNKQEQEEKILLLDKKFENYATTEQLEDSEQTILSMILQLDQELNENYFNKEEILKLLNNFTPGEPGTGIPQITINKDIDLNSEELQKTGIYFLPFEFKYENAPINQQFGGLLLIYADEDTLDYRTYQFLILHQKIYYRKTNGYTEYGSSDDNYNWTDWKLLGDLDPLKIGELKADIDAMSKHEFLKPVEGNLFDNNFIGGYRISGPRGLTEDDLNNTEFVDNSRYTFDAVEGYKGTAIIPIQPNTSYWVGMDQIIKERRPEKEAPDDNRLYSYFALATATKALEVKENFDGGVFRKLPKVDIIGHIFTTGPNDKYLYVQTCRGEVAPYLEVVQIDLNNLPIELQNANKIVYNSENKKEEDTGWYILDTGNWKTLTKLGDYNSVVYTFSDKIKLDKSPEIINLNNKIDSAITNGLSVDVHGNISNLFDGNFISYTKGYRIGGSTISNMASNVNGTNNNPIAVIPVSIGKKYHLYISPHGKEFSSNNNGTITYSYFTKIGASDLIKNEIERKVDRGETFPLGQVGTFTGTNGIITDLYLTIQDQYYIGNNVNSGSIIPKTLIIQTTGDQNVPFIYMEEIEEFPEGLTTSTQYISYNKIPNIIAPINSYGEVNINYGRVNYKLKHEYNPKKGTNTWRWWRHGVDEGIFFDGTDCEGPVRLSNIEEDGTFTTQSDYIGGYHGNELMESVSLLIDGQKVALNSQQSFDNCKTVSMIVESNCYYSQKHLYEVSSIVNNNDGTLTIVYLDGDVNAPEDGGPVNVIINQTQVDIGDAQLKTIIGYSTKYLILNYAREDCLFHRIKHLSFENNKLNIRNYWKYVGPNNKYALNHGFYTGLYSILFKYLNGVSSDYTNRLFTIPLENETDKSSKDLISTEASKYLTEVKFFGKSFDTTIKSLKGQSEYYQGRIQNMLPGSGARYKAYLSDYELGKNTIKLTKNNEFIGEFEITTTAPNEFFLNADGTVNTL